MEKPNKIEMRFANRVEIRNAKNQLHSFGDTPAIIYTDGLNKGEYHYYKNGKLHRDGNKPAITGTSGQDRYFKNGVEYSLDPTAERAAIIKIKELDVLLDQLISARNELRNDAKRYIDACVKKLNELTTKQDELTTKRTALLQSLPLQIRNTNYRYYADFDASTFCREIIDDYISEFYDSGC